MTTATVPSLPGNAPAAFVTSTHRWNERDPEAMCGHLDAAVSED